MAESRLTHAGAVRYFFLTNASEAEAVMEMELAREQLGTVEALSTIAATVSRDGRQSVNLAPRLSELTMPVQVIWGEEDRIIPAAYLKVVPRSAAVHLIPKAAHMVHIEKAEHVNALIQKFIGD